MRLAPIVSLLDRLPTFSKRVEAATTLQQAISKVQTMPSPSIVVHGVTETVDPVQYHKQRTVLVSLKFLIVVRNVSDMRGAAAYEKLDSVLQTYREALHGTVPEEGYSALAHVAGSFAYAEAGTLIWLDEFSTQYQAPII